MLADNIQRLRKEKGLSQEALADRLKVVRQTVSKWENGRSVPDAQMTVRLAEVLDTTVGELLCEKQPAPETETKTDSAAEKLQQLCACEEARRRKERRLWRVVLIAAAVLSVLALISFLLPVLHAGCAAACMSEDLAVIGGADGPTAILVTSSGVHIPAVIICAVLCGAALYGLRRFDRSK